MDIRFDSIKISNFLSLGEAFVSLDGRGFVLVKGVNNESSVSQSNGAGKSSLFDAILWVLTGETTRGTSDVVNENATDGTMCELVLYIDSNKYRLIRTKSHKKYGNTLIVYEGDCEEPLSDQLKKSQDLLSEILPSATSQTIGSVVLLGQELPYKFTNLSPIKRKDLLEELSGYTSQVDKVKSQVELNLNECNSKMIKINSRSSFLDGEVRGLQNTVDALTSQLEIQKDSASVSETIKSHQDEIIKLVNKVEELNDSLKGESDKSSQLNSAAERLDKFITEKKVERDSIGRDLSQFKIGNCPTCGRPYDSSPETEFRRHQLEGQYQSLRDLISSLEVKMQGVKSQADSQLVVVNNLRQTITSLNWQIQDGRKEMTRLEGLLVQSKDLESKIKSIKDDIKRSKIESQEQESKKTEVQETIDCLGYLKRVLSKEFKGYVLEEIIKFASLRSEYYSQYLFSNNKKITISLSGNKILVQVGGRLYENLSGGERQRVDLAVQFALRDLLVTTSGFSCNLLVLDEAFDNLDAQGSESLIRLITSEFTDIDSVFTVTHHSEIDVPYDTIITVVKESNGVSKIVEV